MTQQVETTEQTRADGINVSDTAAAKVKASWSRRVVTTSSCASRCSRVAAPACATSCSSTSGTSTATSSPTSTACAWSSTG